MSPESIVQSKPFAITLDVGSSLLNKTGTWRTERPVYLDRLPPCNHACPAGENIQAWLDYAEEGDYEAAWRQIMEDNPLPTNMGRVCYHPCEVACNRVRLDEAVGIHAVERFLGDQGIKYGWTMPVGEPTGKHVMVVGAGPGGLSAAYHLRRFGHEVIVFESAPKAGGMLRWGIPKYRLPREKLNAEISRIEGMGVKIVLNTKVDEVQTSMKEGGFDAAFLAVGAHSSRSLNIPITGEMPVLEGITVLRNLELDQPTQLRGKVVIYGGGNTAMDVARTAIRLTGFKPKVIVRRGRDRMAAHEFEVDEALFEQVEIINLRTIKQVNGRSVTLEKMVAGEDGRPQATGQYEPIEGDVLVLALGQDVDLGLLEGCPDVTISQGTVLVGPEMMTGHPGIFAGGDMVPSERTVATAIGHGKKAARNIDAYLREETYAPAEKHEIATEDLLNTWYYSDADRTVQPALELIRRQTGFAEVVGDLDESNALFEARRCMSCGNCFECDNCYGVCPDNAVTKLGPGKRFEFKYDYCKGCAMCATECPCGAIKMMPEDI
jgi:NADPH-dependent glutamate synthase beta subunit-like oxidoreductase/Pyruvate/2-oxoacid:ferredoxin oxidoreductase delta subunit